MLFVLVALLWVVEGRKKGFWSVLELTSGKPFKSRGPIQSDWTSLRRPLMNSLLPKSPEWKDLIWALRPTCRGMGSKLGLRMLPSGNSNFGRSKLGLSKLAL